MVTTSPTNNEGPRRRHPHHASLHDSPSDGHRGSDCLQNIVVDTSHSTPLSLDDDAAYIAWRRRSSGRRGPPSQRQRRPHKWSRSLSGLVWTHSQYGDDDVISSGSDETPVDIGGLRSMRSNSNTFVSGGANFSGSNSTHQKDEDRTDERDMQKLRSLSADGSRDPEIEISFEADTRSFDFSDQRNQRDGDMFELKSASPIKSHYEKLSSADSVNSNHSHGLGVPSIGSSASLPLSLDRAFSPRMPATLKNIESTPSPLALQYISPTFDKNNGTNESSLSSFPLHALGSELPHLGSVDSASSIYANDPIGQPVSTDQTRIFFTESREDPSHQCISSSSDMNPYISSSSQSFIYKIQEVETIPSDENDEKQTKTSNTSAKPTKHSHGTFNVKIGLLRMIGILIPRGKEKSSPRDVSVTSSPPPQNVHQSLPNPRNFSLSMDSCYTTDFVEQVEVERRDEENCLMNHGNYLIGRRFEDRDATIGNSATAIPNKRIRVQITGDRRSGNHNDVSICSFSRPLPIVSVADCLLWTLQCNITGLIFSSMIGFFTITTSFALLIWAVARDRPSCIGGVDFDSDFFMDSFTLSWTTFSTVGYGAINVGNSANEPDIKKCSPIIALVTIEAFMGVLFGSLWAAILYAKLAQTHRLAQVTFSKPVLIRNGKENNVDEENRHGEDGFDEFVPCPILEFKVINHLSSVTQGEIVDAEVCAVACIDTTQARFLATNFATREDKIPIEQSECAFQSRVKVFARDEDPSDNINRQQTFVKLSLESPCHPFFQNSWEVQHAIDQYSPLLKPHARKLISENNGHWPRSLNSADSVRSAINFHQILFSLVGTSSANAGRVRAHTVFDYNDLSVEIHFVNQLSRVAPSGTVVISPSKIVSDQNSVDKEAPSFLDGQRLESHGGRSTSVE